MTDIGELKELIGILVAGTGNIEAAKRKLRSLDVEEPELEAAVAEYEDDVHRIRSLRVVSGLEDESQIPSAWYPGPQDDHVFWPAFRSKLSEIGFNSATVSMVDTASDSVLCRLAPPGSESFQTRGLVVGYVQSGKTTNFTAVIAKAADVGYRLFIVLSGLTKNLRHQTQTRLDEQLVGPRPLNWYGLTDEERDFESPGNAPHLLGNPENRLLGVVKKNKSRLQKLNEWLDTAPEEIIQQLPILVIDDEADQASIDVGSSDERSTINRLILELLDRPKAAYVGYTASPFANLLIDPSYPSGLYPRHFILDLPKSEGHFGPETIFGREPVSHDEEETASDGYDMVRHVDPEWLRSLRPPFKKEKRIAWFPEIAPSLDRAIRYFLMATAARSVRGRGVPHSTMLLHTTQLTGPQLKFREPIAQHIRELDGALSSGDHALISSLRSQWENEQERLPPETFDEDPVSFDQLRSHLCSVIDDLELIVDNYRSDERIDYSGDSNTVIVIGGNTLSRGLTLEGLIVSFFVRSVSAYDTLLQMGRWFGYREGYADLPRIWMTPELQSWFVHLATVEQEIRHDIARYEAENLTPEEFAVRIRTHPKLNITSAAKMSDAINAHMSFSARRLQTILFEHRNADWLTNNLRSARRLLEKASFEGHAPEHLHHGRWLIEGVPVELFLDFIEQYEFHENSYDLRTDLIRGYVEEQNSHGELERWNVVVVGRKPSTVSRSIDLGIGRQVGLITRSRLNIPDIPHANIKALMSKVDTVADLGLGQSTASEKSHNELIGMRPNGLGLLLLYPIDKNSQPGSTVKGKSRRVPLDAEQDVIGVGLVFPEASHRTPQAYKSADLSNIDQEEPDFSDFDELDEQTGGEEGEAGREGLVSGS